MSTFLEILVLLAYGLLSLATGALIVLGVIFGTSGQARWMWSLFSGAGIAGITGVLALAILIWLGLQAWAKMV